MKEKSKERKRNKKFRTLILLLFLTIIMFGTSTYAWFTANRVVTINSLDVHVDATNGIQISTDGATWKSVITNADILKGYTYTVNNVENAVVSVNQVPETITAVSTSATATSAGRLNMYSSIIGNDATTGDYNLKTVLEADTGTTSGSASISGKYIAFDIFLRLDSQQTVYLTPESDVTLKATLNQDTGLKNSARVAFVNLGTVAATTEPVDIVQTNTGARNVILWEPNYDAHTQFVVNSVAPDYTVTLTETLDAGNQPTGLYSSVNYWGINTEISEPVDLKQIVNGTLTNIASYATAMSPTIQTKAGNSEYKTFYANMPAGVTKFRVYMWIEGQDIDCENNATGSDISYKIQLSTTDNLS